MQTSSCGHTEEIFFLCFSPLAHLFKWLIEVVEPAQALSLTSLVTSLVHNIAGPYIPVLESWLSLRLNNDPRISIEVSLCLTLDLSGPLAGCALS